MTSAQSSTYAVGQQLTHYTGSVWEVLNNDLPGDGQWEGGMIALRGDYLIGCLAGGEKGNEMRVHRDYLHGDGWRSA